MQEIELERGVRADQARAEGGPDGSKVPLRLAAEEIKEDENQLKTH